MRALAGLVVLGLLVSGCGASPDTRPRQLPEATLAGFPSGSSLDLGAVRGPAVINVWASYCGPCRREMPLYQEFAAAHTGSVKVIGVDFRETSTARASALVRDTGVTYPLFADPDGSLGSRVLPELILVDRDGDVTYRKYVEITSVGQLEKLVDKHLEAAS